MNVEMQPEFVGDPGAPIEDVAQEAIDAVAATYAHDADIDVEEQLRDQLSGRGIRALNDRWVEAVAREIRSGHHVAVGRPDGSVDRG